MIESIKLIAFLMMTIASNPKMEVPAAEVPSGAEKFGITELPVSIKLPGVNDTLNVAITKDQEISK